MDNGTMGCTWFVHTGDWACPRFVHAFMEFWLVAFGNQPKLLKELLSWPAASLIAIKELHFPIGIDSNPFGVTHL